MDFREVISLAPKNPSAYLSLGNYFYREKQYDNAHFNYDKAVELDQNSYQAFHLRGKANQHLGNVNEAMADYNASIRFYKEDGEVFISRGSLNIHLKRIRRACGDFRTAKSLNIEEADELIAKYCR